ncbi:hypothetical protein Scep_010254 [Stephania cephalantha]|uniref:Uncharacterized protein n=1 Tax=Stephania cephalantha TaxID=152367 RepID=A0AAP0PD63_9MAGN
MKVEVDGDGGWGSNFEDLETTRNEVQRIVLRENRGNLVEGAPHQSLIFFPDHFPVLGAAAASDLADSSAAAAALGFHHPNLFSAAAAEFDSDSMSDFRSRDDDSDSAGLEENRVETAVLFFWIEFCRAEGSSRPPGSAAVAGRLFGGRR